MFLRRFFLLLVPVLVVACKAAPTVTSFEECVETGYPVMESYPRQCATPEGETFTEEIKDELPIAVTLPLPNDTISENFIVEGQARGMWYFEASFPIKLVDSDGNVLMEEPMQAQGDWMTTDFVPFHGEYTVDFGGATSGKLILQKDNPSGLPENDASIEIPVLFAP